MKKILLICLGLISWSVSAQDSPNSWNILTSQQAAQKRHESSMVECDGKFYALGGRGKRPIEEFDPKTSNWTVLADAPMEFHHFQAISFQHEIYVVGALTGNYPHEKPIPQFLIFNPKTKTWREGASIPADRLRGSVGVFTRGNKIYLVAGIMDGHYDGHVKWFDEYDTKTNTWKILPDAPRARDHFQAVMVGKDKAYVAGGRTSHAKIGKVLDLCIKEVDVFDFKSNQWSTLAEGLPTLRAGTSSIVNGPYLVVMNGESVKQVPAHSEVEVLDTRTGTWSSLPNLRQGRHGTGVVYWKGKIYVVAGSANRGGGPELNEMECLSWK
ncbi:galactose oxidase [Cytophagaceae bacterium 50C-KIRBA]|uniref:Galactose oxidase n=1 Tax=Aquirufa beregesia TaxID=2516556 RepID=A0ABX0EX01_9BACT|nr:kelch repeat-containing protein [Aquirufa beregesia]NGZ44593.1 galactose oxidase [Aquirufa beregesia]